MQTGFANSNARERLQLRQTGWPQPGSNLVSGPLGKWSSVAPCSGHWPHSVLWRRGPAGGPRQSQAAPWAARGDPGKQTHSSRRSRGNHRTGHIVKEICAQLGLFFLSDFSSWGNSSTAEHLAVASPYLSCLSFLGLLPPPLRPPPSGGSCRHMLTQLNGNRAQQDSSEQGPGQARGSGVAGLPAWSGWRIRALQPGFDKPGPLPAWSVSSGVSSGLWVVAGVPESLPPGGRWFWARRDSPQRWPVEGGWLGDRPRGRATPQPTAASSCPSRVPCHPFSPKP